MNKKIEKINLEETWHTENSAKEIKSTSSDVSSLNNFPFGIITDIDSAISVRIFILFKCLLKRINFKKFQDFRFSIKKIRSNRIQSFYSWRKTVVNLSNNQ